MRRTSRLQIIVVAVLIVAAPGAAFLFEVRMRLRPLLNSWQCISTGGAFFSSAQAAMAGNPAQPSLALHERQIFESSSLSSSVLGMRQTLAQVRDPLSETRLPRKNVVVLFCSPMHFRRVIRRRLSSLPTSTGR